MITDDHRRQFIDEGSFGQEPAIPANLLVGSLMVLSSLT